MTLSDTAHHDRNSNQQPPRAVVRARSAGVNDTPTTIARLSGWRWTEVTLGLTVAAALLVPRGAMTMLAVLAFVAALEALLRCRLDGWALLKPDLVASAFLGLGLLGMFSVLWQAAPAPALQHGAALCINVLLTWLLMHCLAGADRDTHRHLARAALLGFVVGLALLLFELATEQLLHRLLFNIWPDVRPAKTTYFERNGLVVKIRFEQINRSVAMVALLAWPALVIARDVVVGTGQARRTLWGWLVLTALATAIVAQIALSGHESSKLAVLASVGIVGLAWLSNRVAGWTLRIGWLAVVALVVPLTLLAFQARLFETTALQDSGRARLIIWGVAAEKALQAPWLGVGAGSGLLLDAAEAQSAPVLAGQPIKARTGQHQHNVYLQVWYELGLAGASILLIAGWLLLDRLARLPPMSQGVLFGCFAVAASMAGFSYGLWQPWFQAAFAWSFLLAMLWTTSAAGSGGQNMPSTLDGQHNK